MPSFVAPQLVHIKLTFSHSSSFPQYFDPKFNSRAKGKQLDKEMKNYIVCKHKYFPDIRDS